MKGSRVIIDSGKRIRQVLFQWQGAPEEENLWENFDELKANYPRLHLEGKVRFEGVGDDRRDASIDAKFPIELGAVEEGSEINRVTREAEQLKIGGKESRRARREPIWLKDYRR